MNFALIAIGAILGALGPMMAANRSGYVYFVVGPSVLVLAGAIVVAALALRILHAPG